MQVLQLLLTEAVLEDVAEGGGTAAVQEALSEERVPLSEAGGEAAGAARTVQLHGPHPLREAIRYERRAMTDATVRDVEVTATPF